MSNTLKLGNGQWATGKDTLLSFSDTNNNYKPLPFSFSRDSSATVINKDGLIETVGSGEPRIDFKDNTKGALLLEPSRTNYQPYSTNFSVWSVVDVTLSLNYGLSPDGLNNSTLITEGTGSTQHRIVRGSPSSSGIYTFSCFVRNKVGNRQAYIDMGAVTGFFNFDTKTMYSYAGTTNVESWSNDWYRISITSNSNITPSANYIGTGKNNTETFQGDGSSAIEFFAPQLEQGSYPTSVINTSGSAVTRVTESNALPLQGYDLSSSFSLFLSFGKSFKTVQSSMTILSIATSSNNFQLYTNASGNDGINLYLQNQGGYVFNANANDGWNVEQSKICITYDSTSNRLVYFINGSIYGQQTSALNFGTISSGGLNANNNVFETREHKFYTNALTDAEAIALTTI